MWIDVIAGESAILIQSKHLYCTHSEAKHNTGKKIDQDKLGNEG